MEKIRSTRSDAPRRCIPAKTLLSVFVLLVVSVAGSSGASAGEVDSLGRGLVFGRVQVVWTDTVPASLTVAATRRMGEIFSGTVDQERFAAGLRSVLRLLADLGYHRAAVAPGDFTVADNALGFRLVIEPGPPLWVGGWRFTGVCRTDTAWLASVLDLPVGVVWTKALADRISRRLHSVSHVDLAGPLRLESVPTDSSGIVTIPLVEDGAAAIDGMLAASGTGGESASRQLTGRMTVGLSGLFRRDRSVRLRYEKPHPVETLFRLELREGGAFGRCLDWRLAVEEWDRLDHRQTVALMIGHGLSRSGDLRVEVGGRVVRVTPGRSAISPARTGELSLGLTSGPPLDAVRNAVRSLTAWNFQVAYSHRREALSNESSQRGRLDLGLLRAWLSAAGWYGRLTGRAHWWFAPASLAAGDEWFLGGEECLRGYEDRALVASSGVVGAIELGRVWRRGFGLAAFAEAGRLESFETDAETALSPASYGAAILLFAGDRTGRLEVAWRDRARWGEGILRLSVTQGW